MVSSEAKRREASLRILLVDDEPDHQLTVGAVLRPLALEMRMVGSGEEALQALAEQTFDVVVLDLRLRQGGGLNLLRRIKALQPRLPVVVLTAYPSFRSRMQAMAAGASAYLTKPYDPNHLRKVVRHVAEHLTPSAPQGPGVPGWGKRSP